MDTEKLFIAQNSTTLKLLFHITAEILQAFVIAWHKFLYTFFIEVCRLCLQPVVSSAAALRSQFRICAVDALYQGEETCAIWRSLSATYALLCMFTMSVLIENPAACEIRSVIRFLNARKVKPIEIYRQICEVYGQNAMSDSMVRRWVRQFNEGRSEVHDEERSGRPSLVTEELVHAIDDKIRENRRFTISALAMEFPQISRSLIHEIVTEKLKFRKLCRRWVPKILTEQHKTKRMGSALQFLTRYDEGGEEFLTQIVTGDETWVSYDTPESKRQSMEWRHTSSPAKVKPKQILTPRKMMCTVFWDWKGILLIDFLPRGQTIKADAYCETLRKLRRAIQNKRRGLLSKGVVFLHDNARPHTANVTKNLLQGFGWDVFDHPPYSPDLAPSDFHLFLHLKSFLGGQHFNNDEELKENVSNWLKTQAANLYEEGIQKLVSRYDKCLQNFGSYVEK
ncbi:histone-lysine N-methyltransferase SETMAR-like [Anoplophora glabripennis]|uniref:histone-lysine N-methyltransferase SETMAR-like n=1 Tax=Anoplophora glabripennis TaxID=217634 RepID=UPI000C7933CA|nr:histone-lysine N-methyltransferase SETMAR-like [Anoplophora glabripennis]